MPGRILGCAVLLSAAGGTSSAYAVQFFWNGPAFVGPGGDFRTSPNWTFTPPPFPLVPAPGGADDVVNFDLGLDAEDRYTVANVNGENDRLLIRDDSLRLQISDYELLSTDEDNASVVVGVASGDQADVILQGAGNATLRTKEVVLGQGVASRGQVTVDHLQWEIDGRLWVGGFASPLGNGGGDGVLTIRNGSQVASGFGLLGEPDGSIGEVVVTGAGSTWQASSISIGEGAGGRGTLTIQAGGRMLTGNASVTASPVLVEGPGSLWSISGFLSMFFAPNPLLTIRNGGTVIVGWHDGAPLTANSSTVVTLDSSGVLDARGVIDMNTGTFNFLGGTLHVAEFDGNLVNQGGVLAPGNLDEPIGSTNIGGSYTHQSAATLQIEISGATATQHDFLNVEGTALLAGELTLTLTGGFAPEADDQLIVFNADTLLLGAFSNVADGERLATTDGFGSFVVRYGPTSAFNANQVVLTGFLHSADFDEDGDVDGHDLDPWSTGFGTTGTATHMQGDADGDQDVDGADFLVWQQQFGSGASLPVIPIPEPRAVCLAWLALAGARTPGANRRAPDRRP